MGQQVDVACCATARKLTATNILTRVDADTVTWQATDRTEDGKALPDIKPIKFKRVK